MTLGIAALLGMVLAYAFWPRAVMVDIGAATRGPMTVTIDEVARTRVRDAYVVSAPVSGRLLRVEVESGDPVEGGDTTIARMLPLPPSALDIRTREQARAAVSAAQAGVRLARADLNKALADEELASAELERASALRRSDNLSQSELDRVQRAWRLARAALDTSRAAISMREAELASARARLISFSERPLPTPDALPGEDAIPLKAPVSGRVLRIMQESETTLAAGTPIMEIGDVSRDLEIVAELLSGDAVQVPPGARVVIRKWGGPHALGGVVERVEPWGFTKFSALGVEEQRVNAIIRFTDPLERREKLGHGFRVETRIVTWEAENVLTVPSSALFRHASGWAVFAVEGGRARIRAVEIGHSNGTQAQVLAGLETGEEIILYPGPGITDGIRVARRKVEPGGASGS